MFAIQNKEKMAESESEKEKQGQSLGDKLKEIRRKKSNLKCADCAANHSLFVVINFGIFVCSKCCVIHRNLGHRIKCLNVDTFDENEVEMLEKNGNKESNKIYLATFSKKDCNIKGEQYSFIKKKYVDKKWQIKEKQKSMEEIFGEFNWNDNVFENKFDGKKVSTNKKRKNSIIILQSQTEDIFDNDPFLILDINQTKQDLPDLKVQNVQNKNDKAQIMNLFNNYSNPFRQQTGNNYNPSVYHKSHWSM